MRNHVEDVLYQQCRFDFEIVVAQIPLFTHVVHTKYTSDLFSPGVLLLIIHCKTYYIYTEESNALFLFLMNPNNHGQNDKLIAQDYFQTLVQVPLVVLWLS